MWHFIDNRYWVSTGTIEERLQNTCIMLKVKLDAFFEGRHRQNPLEQLTQINDFTVGMLGDKDTRTVGTKGAETWSLILFFVEELKAHPHIIDQPRILRACEALVELITTWQHASWVLTAQELETCFNAWSTFIELTYGIATLEIPKRHLSLHLMRELKVFGTPRFYSVWTDESLNKTLKATCREVHQHTFDYHVLASMNSILRKQEPRR